MSDQKDQAPSSSSQSTDLAIKKRDFTETMPSYSVDDDILFSSMDKKEKLSLLQQKAYSYVLHAFSVESLAISSSRIMIVKELMKELNITLYTHSAIKMLQQLRNVSLASDEKEMQKLTAPEERKITGVDGQPLKIRMKLNKEDMLKIQDRTLAPAKIQDGKVIAPAKIQDEEAKPSSSSDVSPVPSRGQVPPGSPVGRWIIMPTPESLVGTWVNIRMPGESEHIGFLIKGYDEKTETHLLVSAFSKKGSEDPCNWIDLRHIPAKDIQWPKGNPGLPEWKHDLKPGETLLHETSTVRNKKQLKEVGKTSTGIPIIRNVDKGKAIVEA